MPGGSGIRCGNGSTFTTVAEYDAEEGIDDGGTDRSIVDDLPAVGRLAGRGVCRDTGGDFGGGIDSESLISPSSLV